MKKLFRSIALLLLPIVAYYALFIAFEPNNYFGLKPSADGTDIMASLRSYQRAPQNRIILGDSRTAKFGGDIIAQCGAGPYTNLSFGGASLVEQLDILHWAMQLNPQLEEVVFMLSFYTLNQSYSHNRKVVQNLNNPLAYASNLGYNINMFTNLYNHIAPGVAVGDKQETMLPKDYSYVSYPLPGTGQVVQLRQTMASHLAQLRPRSENWAVNQKQFARLLLLISQCRQRGIAFTVVLPPASREVMQYLVQPLGIDEEMRSQVFPRLAGSGATVLNYEFDAQDLLRDDQFYDCFHLDVQRGLDQWTQMLFSSIVNVAQSAAQASTQPKSPAPAAPGAAPAMHTNGAARAQRHRGVAAHGA